MWAKDPKSSSALFRVVIEGKAGYIDEKGQLVISPRFSPFVGDFVDGLALVGRRFIDEHGQALEFPRNGYIRQAFSDSVTIASAA